MTGFKALLTTILVAASICGLGYFMWNNLGLTIIEAGLISAVLFLGVGQCAALISKQMEATTISDEMDDLSRSVSVLAQDVHRTHQQMEEQHGAVTEKLQAHEITMNSQMQLLENFLAELKQGMRKKSGSARRRMNTHIESADDEGTIIENDVTLLEEVRSSIEDNRVDLYLQPVVSLPQRRIRLYEGFSRLRDSSNRVIMPRQYLPLASEAGLMPVIDNQMLFRCVQVMRRLVKRQKNLGIICNISEHSLLDHEFFPQFIEFMDANRQLSSALIFEFSQDTIKNCGPIEFENLASLADFGFSFSMDQVTDLDIDLEDLGLKNFRYLKVESDIFLDGMEQAGAQIHAADLAMLTKRHGIELIIEKIEDENTVLNVVDYKVPFGQGFLFGKPRLVRGDVLHEGAGDKTAAA